MPIIYPVAGGKGGIGKSFITANLGWLLAKERKTVLLSDLDLGSANLHTLLGIHDPGAGLNDFLNKTSPTLMEAIVPCQIPGLFLLSAKGCSMEAANLPYAQIQKITNAITGMPFDFILLDLGAGTHFNTLDFFLTSTDVILVFTQEPTSIESGVRFIETVYYRTLKQLFKQHRINTIISNRDNASTPSIPEIINRLISDTEDDGRALLERLGKISFKIIINQARSQNNPHVGEVLVKLCQRHFYSSFELIGTIDYDEKILDAIISKQLFVRKFPRSKTTYDLMNISKNLVSAKKRPEALPAKPFSDRTFYEILEIRPDALSGDVRQACQATSALYRDNPLVTDAFFSGEEINRILETIDAAGEILSDPTRRSEYDRCLLTGKIDAPDNDDRKEPPGVSEITAEEGAEEAVQDTPAPQPKVQNNPEAVQLLKKIAAQHIISGPDLKELRTASGITIESIFEKTRLGASTLKIIEEEQFDELPPLVYLKGFLKAYAQSLQLPAAAVVDGYLRNIEKKDRYRPDNPVG